MLYRHLAEAIELNDFLSDSLIFISKLLILISDILRIRYNESVLKQTYSFDFIRLL